jgi:hypothetical protein
MARTARLQLKDIRTSKTSSSSTAIKQLLVLILTIIIGMLVSVSCNAQKMSAKKKLPYKTKNRAHANHYAKVIDNAPVKRSSLLVDILDKEIIREMVAQNLLENSNNAPVQLAPLVFGIKQDQLTAVDVNPILIAIEFGRQGKTILLESFSSKNIPAHQQLSSNKVQEVKLLMHEMGVPAERVSIVACHDLNDGRIHNARIDFTAI